MSTPPHLPDTNWPEFLPGSVWLCGAGPGDPGLLTLHALNALKQADVLIYDALIDAAILEWANPECEQIAAGKRAGRVSPKQVEISERMIALARAGKRVLRLKGGDPFVFGRGGEEAQTLVQSGIPFRVIPGITAGIGGLAYAGIPATHRDVNQSLTFVTGHDLSGKTPETLDWASISKGSQVIVIYMGLRHMGAISARLLDAGRPKDEPVALVFNASHPDQQVVETTLSEAASIAEANKNPAPAIICIGEAVRMRQALDWQAMASGWPARNTDPLGHSKPDAT